MVKFYLIGSIVGIATMLFQRYLEYKYSNITFKKSTLIEYCLYAGLYSWVCVPMFLMISWNYKKQI